MNIFHSGFASHLGRYVEVRRKLGLRFDMQESVLRAFDRYVHERNYSGALNQGLALDFANASEHGTGAAARRYLIVRHFAQFLAIYDPSTPCLDPKAIIGHRQQPPPYIFADNELEQLLQRTNQIPHRCAAANLAMRTMIGLAASTGLRLREVISLDEADVDFGSGVLNIRRSKFDKDRLVPVHPSTLEALHDYAKARSSMPRAPEQTAFFLNTEYRRHHGTSVGRIFSKLVRKIDLQSPHRRLPTFGSLRHTFAVRRLVAWYRAGADVQALLPALATFMGHVHYTSTSYYLTATAELLGVAAERLLAKEVPNA
jgi:integrase